MTTRRALELLSGVVRRMERRWSDVGPRAKANLRVEFARRLRSVRDAAADEFPTPKRKRATAKRTKLASRGKHRLAQELRRRLRRRGWDEITSAYALGAAAAGVRLRVFPASWFSDREVWGPRWLLALDSDDVAGMRRLKRSRKLQRAALAAWALEHNFVEPSETPF